MNIKSQKNTQTGLVYSKALGWSDSVYSYYVTRAEQEIDKILAQAPSLLENAHKSSVCIVGGSGRHAFAAISRGFKYVKYLDITSDNIKRAKRIAKQQKIKNLSITHADIADYDNDLDCYDLVIMNGVLQHLQDPVKGLRLICNLAKPNGIIYFDCYSAGSLYMLIIEWLRQFFYFSDFERTMKFIDDLGVDIIDLNFTSAKFSERLSDDIFVPYIGYFVEKHIIDTLEKANFRILQRDYSPEINHALPRYDSFQFLIQRTTDSMSSFINFSATSNFNLRYSKFPYIQDTLEILENNVEKLIHDSDKRDRFLIGFILRFHDWTKRRASGQTCHQELQSYLMSL